MLSVNTVNKVLKETIEGAKNSVEKIKDVKESMIETIMTSKDIDVVKQNINYLVKDVDTIYTAQVVNGISLPQRIVKVQYDGGMEFVLILRSKLKAETKYMQKKEIRFTKNMLYDISDFFAEFLTDLFLIEVANENVGILNEKIKEICKDFKIPYTFGFDIIPEAGVPYVTKITDNEVRYSVDILNAKYISELPLLQSGDRIKDLGQKDAQDDLVTTLYSIQTTPQLIKSKIDLIKQVTGVATKKHANKIIRECYHRNAKYLDSLKTGDAYFSNIVKIDGEDVDVFAIIHKDIDGTLSVLLHPFDIDTLFNVDFDVLAEIKNER